MRIPPWYLRQIVRLGIDTGFLSRRNGVWRREGPISAGDLENLLAEQLTAIPADQLLAFEHVAVGEPLGLAVLHQLGFDQQFDALSSRGLLEQDANGQIRIIHSPTTPERPRPETSNSCPQQRHVSLP